MIGHARPLQRLLGRSACPGVAKPDCGAHGAPAGVEEDLGARRAAGHHRGRTIQPMARRQRRHGIGEGAPPSFGVLLRAAGSVLVEPHREGDRRLHRPVEGEQSGFQRRSSEIDGQDPTHESLLLIAALSGNPVRMEGSPEGVRQVKSLWTQTSSNGTVAGWPRVVTHPRPPGRHGEISWSGVERPWRGKRRGNRDDAHVALARAIPSRPRARPFREGGFARCGAPRSP